LTVYVVPAFKLPVAEPVGAILRLPAIVVSLAKVFAREPESVRLLNAVPLDPLTAWAAPFKVTVPVLVNAPGPLVFDQFPATLWLNEPPARVPAVIDTFPAIVVLVASVVVPPLTVRLLKDVNTTVGRVLVAVSSTVPVPGVQVLPLTAVIAPPILSVPPLVMFIVPLAAPPFPSARLPPASVDPLPKLSTPARRPLFPPTVIAPLAVRLVPAFVVSVDVTFPLVSPTVSEAIEFVGEMLSVTVSLFAMFTESPATPCPG
jgi:hypothetical protein